MPTSEHILEQLKLHGQRLTDARQAMIRLFVKHAMPLSADQVHAKLAGTTVNRTTVYRELAFLETQGVIRKVELGDRISRYEIVDESHHHHVVCTNCKRVEDVEADADFETQEQKLAQKTGFSITGHSLEFFGVCPACLS